MNTMMETQNLSLPVRKTWTIRMTARVIGIKEEIAHHLTPGGQ
jgi:hypothetical protein